MRNTGETYTIFQKWPSNITVTAVDRIKLAVLKVLSEMLED